MEKRLQGYIPSYPTGPGFGSSAFLLFDDGQDTYDDHFLWSLFFKNISDKRSSYRAVVFSSYGSPSENPVSVRRGTPPALKEAARINLWPRENARGLLLDFQEFSEVVERFFFDKSLKIDSSVSDLIFQWTNGHAGAVYQLLTFTWNKVYPFADYRAMSFLMSLFR